MLPRLLLIAPLLLCILLARTQAPSPVIDSLQKIINQDKKDSAEAAAYLSLIYEYARIDIGAAKQCCFNLMALCRESNLPVPLSGAYSNLVTLDIQTNQPDSARYYLHLLEKLAGENSHSRVQSNYNLTAGLFYRKQGNYRASIPYMLEGLRLYTAEGNKVGMAGQHLNIGNNYQDMGEYRNAMTYHLKALDLFEEIGNRRGMSFAYSAIGGDFTRLGQYAKALPYIQRSLALKTELNDKKGRATAYVDLGDIHEGLQHPEEALANYKEALALDRALTLTLEEAKVDLIIGKLYAQKRSPEQAAGWFTRSRDLFLRLGDTAYVTAVNAEIAGLEKKGPVDSDDEKAFLASLATSTRTGDRITEINNYKYLADFYTRRGQYDKALQYNERYHTELDSFQNKDLQLQVRALEQQYNLEKKEEEISLLKKDRQLYQANLRNQEIFRYGAILFICLLLIIGLLVMARWRVMQRSRRQVEIEKMRNQIARNLHDDIGSTLSSINIMSKVALQQVDGHPSVSRDLEKIKDCSSIIMESMNDIVWAINPANDPIDKTILKMKEFAVAMLEPAGIGFSFREEGRLSDMKLGVEERKNLYLIFKEAINNVVKYSRATQVDIVLQVMTHRFQLKITDNGKGFDTERSYTGNGLKNMQSRASEMRALYEIDSSPAGGTRIGLELPI